MGSKSLNLTELHHHICTTRRHCNWHDPSVLSDNGICLVLTTVTEQHLGELTPTLLMVISAAHVC